ncbi:hypothetical protein [Streptomyces sp. NPDC048277]|uniref:hypothetical protein n=1 Tax=Streptomyces sp. NPDC048277 TaxID=3155027 RepID=UPI0033EC6176
MPDSPRRDETAPDVLPEGVLPEDDLAEDARSHSRLPEAEEAAVPALTVLGSGAAAVCTDGVCAL